jgi:Fe-S-cluster containining protein
MPDDRGDSDPRTRSSPAGRPRAEEHASPALGRSDLERLDFERLDRDDDRFVERIDALMAGAARSCGARWSCGPGRVSCCIGPFPIHQLDAHRLRRGLHELERTDPERAAAIRRRAAEAVAVLAEDFPGDLESGVLDEDEEELERLCVELHDQPCPVLDPESGLCSLYAFRPRVCRTFGPPLRLGEDELPECPYCFERLGAREREALRVEPDPEGEEDRLLDRLASLDGRTGLTLIALALRADPGHEPKR